MSMGIGDNFDVKTAGSVDSTYTKKRKEDLQLQKQENIALAMQSELRRLNQNAPQEQSGQKEFTITGLNIDEITPEQLEKLKQKGIEKESTEEADNVEADNAGSSYRFFSDRYKGENKPAKTANWADLNGNYFEVIDEPDENGNVPTRPIRGEIKIEGEAKNGENPKKFTITDKNNGEVYTFELDETQDGKVVYKCTSGPGGAYKEGNEYELRTINGVPMLVQMKESEGYGVAVGKTKATTSADNAESPADGANDVDGTQQKPPAGGSEQVEGTQKSPAEQREETINKEAAALEVDLTPKKKIDKDLQAKADKIGKAQKEAPQVAQDIKDELEAFWTDNDDARALLSKITPENAAYVIAAYPNIADKIDNVIGMDTDDIYEYLYKPLKARLVEHGLPDPFGEGKTLGKGANLKGMQDWIKKAASAIAQKDTEITKQFIKNHYDVSYEQKNLEAINTKAKPVIDKANKTLAEAANAEPKLEVKKDEDGSEYVKLADGRRVCVERNDQGEIVKVWIDNDNDNKDYDVFYSQDCLKIDTNNENKVWEYSIDNDNRYDYDKILALANRIFGEKPQE